MSQHLSAEEISNWMIGGRTPHVEQHVRDCPQCQAEVVRLDETLAHFRGSVRSLTVPPAKWEPARPQPLRWVLAVAALLILAAVPIYRNLADRQQARADTILLEQVDAALSRTVPAPMETLAKLVSWEPEKGENK